VPSFTDFSRSLFNFIVYF